MLHARKRLEHRTYKILKFAERLQVVLELAVQIKRLFWRQLGPYDHVAQMHRMWHYSIVVEFL